MKAFAFSFAAPITIILYKLHDFTRIVKLFTPKHVNTFLNFVIKFVTKIEKSLKYKEYGDYNDRFKSGHQHYFSENPRFQLPAEVDSFSLLKFYTEDFSENSKYMTVHQAKGFDLVELHIKIGCKSETKGGCAMQKEQILRR